MAANYEAVSTDAVLYIDEVKRHLPVERVFLFGSYAKNTADERSDVDIAFFFRDYGSRSRIEVGVLLLKLCRSYKSYFEPLVFKIADMECDNPFINEILRTGKEIIC